jgi:hypothetical protein
MGNENVEIRPEDVASTWFWELIRRANHSHETLYELLRGLTKGELHRFYDEFEAAAAELKAEPFLEFIDPEESEDGIDDIADWVVSQGFEHYKRTWETPSLIPARIDVGDPGSLSGVAGDVYFDKFGESIGSFKESEQGS